MREKVGHLRRCRLQHLQHRPCEVIDIPRIGGCWRLTKCSTNEAARKRHVDIGRDAIAAARCAKAKRKLLLEPIADACSGHGNDFGSERVGEWRLE